MGNNSFKSLARVLFTLFLAMGAAQFGLRYVCIVQNVVFSFCLFDEKCVDHQVRQFFFSLFSAGSSKMLTTITAGLKNYKRH